MSMDFTLCLFQNVLLIADRSIDTQIPPDNGRISLTINNGNGGVRQKADGSRYCDMRGTGSGSCSYLLRFPDLR